MKKNIEKETNPTFNRFKNNLLKWKDSKDRVKIIFQLISIFLSILIMILCSLISYDSEVSKSIAEELVDNFETGFFMDFSDIDIGEKVKFGKWQGTVKGCGIIKNGQKQAARLGEGEKCENGEFIEMIPYQDIDTYKELTLYGIKKGRYLDLLYDGSIIKKNQNENDCPEGKKKLCGYIDTLQNRLCINNNTKCPVSYIKIQENEPEPDVDNLITINGSDINFYYSNDPYSNGEIPYILNSFKIAGVKMCALPNLYYSTLSLHNLDRNKNKYSSNCTLNDYSQKVIEDIKRYNFLDEVDNYELYEENNIIEKIMNSKLINYGFNIDDYIDNKLYLYTRSHFGFDVNCLKKMNFSEENLIYIYSRGEKMLHYGNWNYFVIIIIFFSITNFFSFSGYFSPNLISLETLIKYFVIFVSSFSLLIYSYFAIDYDDYYSHEMTCSDFITNDNYNIMIYKVQRSGFIIKLTFIIYLLLFINILFSIKYVYIIKLINKCNKKKIFKKSQFDNNNNNIIKNLETKEPFINKNINKENDNNSNIELTEIKNNINKELKKNQEISEDKKKENDNILNNEDKNFVNEKKEKIPLNDNFMINTEKKFNKIADDKINELMSQFYYVEDKIPFNEDNFYSLIQEKNDLSSEENNEKINQLILNISQNKSNEYNNILVPKLPSWKKTKQEIELQINNKCNEFYNKIFNNENYKEKIIFDMKELDDSINSLNLFNQIKKNKFKEIENLINQIKQNTKDRINNKKNELSIWDDQKEKLISQGIQIMVEKSKENLNTKNENDLIQILINEIKNYPKFFDSCKNENQIDEIIKQLKIKAKPIVNDYIKKVNETEEKEEKEKKAQAQYFPRTPYKGVSLVDGLVAIGANHTYDYRAKIAARNGIQGYNGSSSQNTYLLNLLKNGKLLRP